MSSKLYIDILLCFDDKSCAHAAATIQSAIENNKSDKITFHIFHRKISIYNRQSLHIYLYRNYKHARIYFYRISRADYESIPVMDKTRFPVEAYFRLLASKYLPESINKILYVDIDTIFVDDPSEIFEYDLGSTPFAAVKEWVLRREKYLSLDLPPNSHYFQTGVMLINLKLWRENNYSNKIVKFISEINPELLEFADQDALNMFFKGQIKELPLKYNLAPHFYLNPESPYLWGRPHVFFQSEVKDALSSPVILHFTGEGKNKPWHPNCRVPKADCYKKYLAKTPFNKI